MATKTEAQIKEFLAPYLHTNEEFRWLGAPQKNAWHLKLETIPLMIHWLITLIHWILFSLRWAFAYLLYCATAFALDYAVIQTLSGASLFTLRSIIFPLAVEFWLALLWVEAGKRLVARYRRTRDLPKPSLSSLPHFWEAKYFSITNQRVLIFEQGSIHDYSLLLMADAIVSKPRDGASTIHIYSSTNPTGQLPEPVFELKGIAEEEAQAAYEILRQAREEALEDRAREMGID